MLALHPPVDHGLESSTSSHIRGFMGKFISLYFLNKYPPIYIIDSSSSPVVGERVMCATTSLIVDDFLLVPKFLVSWLSISQITK